MLTHFIIAKKFETRAIARQGNTRPAACAARSSLVCFPREKTVIIIKINGLVADIISQDSRSIVSGFGNGFGLLSLHNPVARAARALMGRYTVCTCERGDRPNFEPSAQSYILV